MFAMMDLELYLNKYINYPFSDNTQIHENTFHLLFFLHPNPNFISISFQFNSYQSYFIFVDCIINTTSSKFIPLNKINIDRQWKEMNQLEIIELVLVIDF